MVWVYGLPELASALVALERNCKHMARFHSRLRLLGSGLGRLLDRGLCLGFEDGRRYRAGGGMYHTGMSLLFAGRVGEEDRCMTLRKQMKEWPSEYIHKSGSLHNILWI
jgi:hypothetical protein